MTHTHRFCWRVAQVALLGLLAAVLVTGPFDAPRPAVAQNAGAKIAPELGYVPHDAALFLHVDVAKVWDHEAVKKFRAADKKLFDLIEGYSTKLSGMKPEDLKSVTLFLPTAKRPEDMDNFGLVLSFKEKFDKRKVEGGFESELRKNVKIKVVAHDANTAVVLVGLDDKFAKPRPAGEDGPLTPALRAASSGKHALVAGATPANLPDELRGDEVPAQLRALKPLFEADVLTATVDLGASLDLDVRAKAKRAGVAVDVEKSLAALADLLTGELNGVLPDFEKDAAGDAGLKDAVKVVKALLAAVKDAKYSVDGADVRMTASLPLKDLPLVSAYKAAVAKIEGAAALSRSANNLKQIGIAMHNYHDTHNAFPPAAVCDKKGKPQLSWRVLILPYIEENELYKQFKLDEPWDSENNKKLIEKMPKVYAMPGKSKPGDTDTYYRVFVGNGAGFDWLTGTKILGITDGTSNTFMCVTAATAVPWTKPDELEFDPEKDMGKLIGMVVNGKAQAAMFDGSVRTLGKLPAKDVLAAVITRAGGEVVPDF